MATQANGLGLWPWWLQTDKAASPMALLPQLTTMGEAVQGEDCPC